MSITCKKNFKIVYDSFLTVNYPPFTISIDFPQTVEEIDSHAKIENGTLTLTIKKITKEIWNTLDFEIDKSELKKRRKESQLRKEEKYKELNDKSKTFKSDNSRFALRQQVKMVFTVDDN